MLFKIGAVVAELEPMCPGVNTNLNSAKYFATQKIDSQISQNALNAARYRKDLQIF